MKKIVIVLMLTMLLVTFGCESGQGNLTDLSGNEIVIPESVERIISNAPSNTEILIELGLVDNIIGVSKYDSNELLPEDIVKFDIMNPDVEAIVALEPDVVFATGMSLTDGDDPLALVKEAGIAVIYIPSASSVGDIYETINFLGQLVEEEKKAENIIDEMKSEIEKVMNIAKSIEVKKNVYFEISPAPYIYSTGADTFQNEMIEIVGAKNIFAEESGWFSPSVEVIIEKNPQVIISNVSYIEDAVGEIKGRVDGFETIQAIEDNMVFKIDSDASSRPSQNIIKAIKELAKAIYPEYYEDL